LSSSRRVFLKSLSRSALVLSLENVLGLARPRGLLGNPRQNANPPKDQSADLGISFLNVARESGLNAKTIFGGEHKNKYLLETTGCVVVVGAATTGAGFVEGATGVGAVGVGTVTAGAVTAGVVAFTGAEVDVLDGVPEAETDPPAPSADG